MMNISHKTIQRNATTLIISSGVGLTGEMASHVLPDGGRLDMNSQLTGFGMPTLQDTDVSALRALAQTYFDAAYEMDAEKFASIFHPSSSVTKVAEDGTLSVTPIANWLAAVRNAKAPQQQGSQREDQILSIDAESDLALVKVKLRVPPRSFTDLLSCLKVNGSWKIAQKVMTSNA